MGVKIAHSIKWFLKKNPAIRLETSSRLLWSRYMEFLNLLETNDSLKNVPSATTRNVLPNVLINNAVPER